MRYCILLALALMLVSCTTTRTVPGAPAGTADYVSPVSDPLECVNRVGQDFNGCLNNYLVYPIGSIYRAVLPSCARRGMVNFTKNLAYPVRLVNNCLQGKFGYAWDETKRFGINTTVGVLGFGDFAKDWGISEHVEDFGQTFAYYGMGPGCFLNLPFFGPSNVRDCIGSILSYPFNLPNWICPDEALYINGGGAAVNAIEKSQWIRQFFSTEYDTYMLTRAAYEVSRQAAVMDFTPPEIDSNPEESLGFMLLKPKSEFFLDWEYTHYIKLPNAKKKLPYSCWLAKGEARRENRIMVLLPGLGGHRLSNGVAALAELYVNAGWSVIAFSSTMHPEVFRAMPEQAFPGNLRKEAGYMGEAIKLALEDFGRRHPKYAASECSVLGYSLGAMNALFMSALGMPFKCNRIIAVNPPQNPVYALGKIDEFFAVPEKWGEDAEKKAHQLFLRVAAVLGGNAEVTNIPLTREESQFLIGLFMRLPLVDVIMAMAEDGMYALEEGKDADFAKVLSMRWTDYVEKVMLPAEMKEDANVKTVNDLVRKYNIGSIEKQVRDDDRIRLVHNENDFLLGRGEYDWFWDVFTDRATYLDGGSHLGNIFMPEYQQMLLKLAE